ncbi:DUF5686 family protein [Mesonia aestuariivivens]|uniref:DUF5686 and carboxypeptidase regulatory-like domain-containing protein n=1 Tax=Mesonia aestuariivivens TaxID=2796128 RepID=A0ABS6W2B2_9FLAO|nr:DUF5686 family protein [Mesonia aestuariivivens]MBW2961864.1 DUF5686 and carboxypeptidase regulatory-like domain-containing protein [Mesonia aestuariivivens]
MTKPQVGLILLFFLCIITFTSNAQQMINGVVKNAVNGEYLPYASVVLKPSNESFLSKVDGSFEIEISETTKSFQISYIGYNTKNVVITNADFYQIQLQPNPEQLAEVHIQSETNKAEAIIKRAIAHKPQNNPKEKFKSYQYKTYNKFIIDNEKSALNLRADSTKNRVKAILEDGRNYLSEKSSLIEYDVKKGEKETITATRTAGFKEPVYELLATNVQSNSWYEKYYVIYGAQYSSPLSDKALKNYNYKILDTTSLEGRAAYAILFQAKKKSNIATLEGLLYIDTLNFGIQKAIGQLKGKANLEAVQEFSYYPEKDIWFPKKNTVTIKPGSIDKDISIFGGNVAIGRLPEKNKENEKLYLKSISTYQEVKFNRPVHFKKSSSKITLLPNAIKTSDSTWQELRTIPFTNRDQQTFQKVDSIIKKENLNRKIEVIQHFNNGYYPLGFFDFDLRTLIKYNQYEGLRLGLGGVTNEKLSSKFRLQGYGVYGFKDHTFKYSIGGGISLKKESGTWLNFLYTDDIAEVGSFQYLTDARVYSLFEPRLVNINYYYKYKKTNFSLQHRFTPKLLSEFQVSRNEISQTKGYFYETQGNNYSDYTISKATASFRWSPFSDYLKSTERNIEVKEGFPQLSFQATQAFKNVLGSDFNFTKLGAKINYTYERLNQTSTEVILEGNYGFGEIPLNHSFHAYPNNPQKEKIMQRFSVAGRRTFETMYFSEFFSDRLANIQVKHFLKRWDLGKYSNPQLVLITRHAIGNMSDQNKHYGIKFNTLEHGYSESGFEINNIVTGFGLNFAYRYGAYHLPKFEDNIAFKFTFYFKL